MATSASDTESTICVHVGKQQVNVSREVLLRSKTHLGNFLKEDEENLDDTVTLEGHGIMPVKRHNPIAWLLYVCLL